MYFVMQDFSSFQSDNFWNAISWKCFLQEWFDCIWSRLTEFQSSPNRKFDVDPMYVVLVSLPRTVNVVHDVVHSSQWYQDPAVFFYLGSTSRKKTFCLLLDFWLPGGNPELIMCWWNLLGITALSFVTQEMTLNIDMKRILPVKFVMLHPISTAIDWIQELERVKSWEDVPLEFRRLFIDSVEVSVALRSVRWRLMILSSPINDRYFHEWFSQPIVSQPEISSCSDTNLADMSICLNEIFGVRNGIGFVKILSHECRWFPCSPKSQNVLLHLLQHWKLFSVFSALDHSPDSPKFCFIVSNDEILRFCFFSRIDIIRSPQSVERRGLSFPLLRRPSTVVIQFGTTCWREDFYELLMVMMIGRFKLVCAFIRSPQSVLFSSGTPWILTSVTSLPRAYWSRATVSWQQMHHLSRFCCDAFFSWILLRSFPHCVRAHCGTWNGWHWTSTQMIPLMTCEIFFGWHVSELVFGVNVFSFGFWDPDSIKWLIKRFSVSPGNMSCCGTPPFNDHLDHCFIVFKHTQQSFLMRRLVLSTLIFPWDFLTSFSINRSPRSVWSLSHASKNRNNQIPLFQSKQPVQSQFSVRRDDFRFCRTVRNGSLFLLHIQLIRTNVWLPKMHNVPPEVGFVIFKNSHKVRVLKQSQSALFDNIVCVHMHDECMESIDSGVCHMLWSFSRPPCPGPPSPAPLRQKFRSFFPSPASIFILSSLGVRFVDLWWCDWRPGPSNVHVWSSRAVVWTWAALGPPGAQKWTRRPQEGRKEWK